MRRASETRRPDYLAPGVSAERFLHDAKRTAESQVQERRESVKEQARHGKWQLDRHENEKKRQN